MLINTTPFYLSGGAGTPGIDANTTGLLRMGSGGATNLGSAPLLNLMQSNTMVASPSKFEEYSYQIDSPALNPIYGWTIADSRPAELDITGDFTIDFWIYKIADTGAIFSAWNNDQATQRSYRLTGYTGGELQFQRRTTVGGQQTVTTAAIPHNVWSHVAIQRSGSVLGVYVNGILGGTTSGVGTMNSTHDMKFGNVSGDPATITNATYQGRGHLSEIRISNTARYTADFTPPTSHYV